MLGLYLTKLRWELHDAAWAHLLGDNEYADKKLLSIAKRYLKHVSEKVDQEVE